MTLPSSAPRRHPVTIDCDNGILGTVVSIGERAAIETGSFTPCSVHSGKILRLWRLLYVPGLRVKWHRSIEVRNRVEN